MREKEHKTIFVNEKNIKARVILFALAFVVAVGSFTAGILSLRRQGKDVYEEINNFVDSDVPHYSDGIHYYCNFDRVNSDRPARVRRQAQEAYNEALKHAYKLLDASQTYSDFINIATINSRPNEVVTVSEELYQVLQDAASRTSLEANYSIYAGALFGEWGPILQSENCEDFDPARSDYEAQRIRSITEDLVLQSMALSMDSVTPESEAVTLKFLGSNQVRLVVPERVAELYRSLEVTAPILDLNTLHDAYLLQVTSALMAKKTVTYGYFYADSGILLDLDEKRAYVLFDAAGLEGDGYAYAIDVNGQTKLRHQYFCLATGTFTDLLQQLTLEGPQADLAALAAARAYLNSVEGPLQIASFEAGHPAWTLQYTYQ